MGAQRIRWSSSSKYTKCNKKLGILNSLQESNVVLSFGAIFLWSLFFFKESTEAVYIETPQPPKQQQQQQQQQQKNNPKKYSQRKTNKN